MGLDRILEEAMETVRKIVPKEIEITSIDFEGPVVVLYTKHLEAMSQNNDIIRQLAQGLRRRVAIRPDPAMLADEATSEEKIRRIIPAEAQIEGMYFDGDTGEVTIEAMAPGLAIGKHGAVLNEIKRETGWAPKVVRTPPIPSKTISDIRSYLRKTQEERKDFLRKVGRRLARPRMEGENWLRITSLGGYREVGRSATLVTTRDSKVLVDVGVAITGEANGLVPYFTAPELMPLESLDAIVLTHAHLDHCGLVPALYKYGYDGPIYCTPPTRDIMSLLTLDYVKIAFGEGKKSPYDSSHIRDAVKHTIPLKWGETTDITPDIRLTFQNAGHILGSSIAHFHIGNGLYNLAISGDIKFEKSWLFNPAVNRFPRLETLVIESTYGGYHDVQPSRVEASHELRDVVKRTLERGGHVLIPVFAVGRSQEVMLVLEELMRTNQIPRTPIWLDGMIWEATAIHTAYPEYLNSQLRTQIFQQGENPFLSELFRRVETSEMREGICHDPSPCVVLATSGMMSGGPVLEYFKSWADDEKNTLVFVGFNSEGSLGRRIQRGLEEITLMERGKPVTIKVKLETVTVDGFSGHCDRRQLINFVSTMEPRPERVIVCHGEEYKSLDLASTLYKKFGMETRVPMNLETIRLK